MRSLREVLRRRLPHGLRRLVAQTKRRLQDARRQSKAKFTSKRVEPAELARFTCAVDIEQPIRRTAHFEGKMHNIRLAVARMNHIRLQPSEALSFWRIVGSPTAKNGFQVGRGIVDNRLSADVGGGLCQIASLLYELGLRAGATILERHPHSRDLYTEDNRFTPLGLDATIVWGFKDVRLANPYPHTLAFVFDVEGSTLRGRLFSAQPIAPLDLVLAREDDATGRLRTAKIGRRDGKGSTAPLTCDTYIIDVS